MHNTQEYRYLIKMLCHALNSRLSTTRLQLGRWNFWSWLRLQKISVIQIWDTMFNIYQNVLNFNLNIDLNTRNQIQTEFNSLESFIHGRDWGNTEDD